MLVWALQESDVPQLSARGRCRKEPKEAGRAIDGSAGLHLWKGQQAGRLGGRGLAGSVHLCQSVAVLCEASSQSPAGRVHVLQEKAWPSVPTVTSHFPELPVGSVASW